MRERKRKWKGEKTNLTLKEKNPIEVVIIIYKMVYLFSGNSMVIRSAVIKHVRRKNNESEVFEKY